MYKKALEGKILNFTGVSASYDEPENAELVVDTNKVSILNGVEKVIELDRKH